MDAEVGWKKRRELGLLRGLSDIRLNITANCHPRRGVGFEGGGLCTPVLRRTRAKAKARARAKNIGFTTWSGCNTVIGQFRGPPNKSMVNAFVSGLGGSRAGKWALDPGQSPAGQGEGYDAPITERVDPGAQVPSVLHASSRATRTRNRG